VAAAVALQRRLLALMFDLIEAVNRTRLPKLSLPPKYLAAKLERGVPALTGEPVPLPVALLRPTLLQLCAELGAGGAGEPADRIRAALAEGQLDAGSLLVASFARDQTAIRTGAVHRGLAPDLLWLVAELATGPFAHALQHSIFAAPAGLAPPLAAALAAWTQGYCPACGSWPALVETAGGRRTPRCSFCAAAWELPPGACLYCGQGGDTWERLFPPGRTDRHVEACGACRGYVKAVDVAELSPFPLLAITDLETMDLDLLAMERRFGRPALKEFTRAGASAR
jgi:FdhE protein